MGEGTLMLGDRPGAAASICVGAGLGEWHLADWDLPTGFEIHQALSPSATQHLLSVLGSSLLF